MKSLRLAVLVIAWLAASAQAGETLDDHSTILVGPDQARIFGQMSRNTPDPKEGLWVPTPEQVNAMWRLLPAFVEARKMRLKPFDSYHRQYVGFLHGGRRFIYLNAFKMYGEEGWREHPVVTGDGGSAYFGVEYDLEAGKLLNLEVNGPF